MVDDKFDGLRMAFDVLRPHLHEPCTTTGLRPMSVIGVYINEAKNMLQQAEHGLVEADGETTQEWQGLYDDIRDELKAALVLQQNQLDLFAEMRNALEDWPDYPTDLREHLAAQRASIVKALEQLKD